MKNGTCYYFDDITKIEDFDYDLYWMKNQTKPFWSMTCHTKL